MGKSFNQLRALMYKNYIYKKRNLTVSIFSILLGVIIGILSPEDVNLYNCYQIRKWIPMDSKPLFSHFWQLQIRITLILLRKSSPNLRGYFQSMGQIDLFTKLVGSFQNFYFSSLQKLLFIYFLVQISTICLIFHLIIKIDFWKYPFYFQTVSTPSFYVGHIIFGWSYLSFSFFWLNFFSNDPLYAFGILYASSIQVFFLNVDQNHGYKISQNSSTILCYFGQNFLLHISNTYVCIVFLILLIILNFLVQYLRQQRNRKKPCCSNKWHYAQRLTSVVKQNLFQDEDNQFQNINYQVHENNKVISINNLQKSYSSGSFALKNITFDLFQNEIACIIGKNGSGKSTLIQILSGLIKQDKGSIGYFNNSIKFGSNQFFQQIGYCPQENTIPKQLTCKELFQLFFKIKVPLIDHKKIQDQKRQIFESLDIQSTLQIKFGCLSSGTKRKILLALSLINKPKLLLLDQPISGLDYSSRLQFWKLLYKLKQGRCILVISHDTNECQDFVQKYILLNRGQIKKFWHISDLKNEVREKVKLIFKPQTLINLKSSNIKIQQQMRQYIYNRQNTQMIMNCLKKYNDSNVEIRNISLDEYFTHYILDIQSIQHLNDRNDRVKCIESQIRQKYLQISLKQHSNLKKLFRIFSTILDRRIRSLLCKKRGILTQMCMILVLFSDLIFGFIDISLLTFRFQDYLSLYIATEVLSRKTQFVKNTIQTGVSLFVYFFSVFIADIICLITFYSILFFIYWLYQIIISNQAKKDLISGDPNLLEAYFYLFPYQLASLSYSYCFSLVLRDPYFVIGISTAFNSLISYYLFFLVPDIALYIFPHLTSTYYFNLLMGFENKNSNHDYLQISNLGRYIILLQIGQIIFYLLIFLIVYSCWYRKYFSKTSHQVQQKKEQQNFNSGENFLNTSSNLLQNQEQLVVSCQIKSKNLMMAFQFYLVQGQIIAIRGPTQSGKSTLINIIQRSNQGDFKGKLNILGNDSMKLSQRIQYNKIGFCSEEDFFYYDYTPAEFMQMSGNLKGLINIDIIEQIYYLSKLFDFYQYLDTKLQNLSGGTQRKVQMSIAFLGDPQLVIIDKISKGIDPVVSQDLLIGIYQLIKNTNKSLLFTTSREYQGDLISDKVIITMNNKELVVPQYFRDTRTCKKKCRLQFQDLGSRSYIYEEIEEGGIYANVLFYMLKYHVLQKKRILTSIEQIKRV